MQNKQGDVAYPLTHIEYTLQLTLYCSFSKRYSNRRKHCICCLGLFSFSDEYIFSVSAVPTVDTTAAWGTSGTGWGGRNIGFHICNVQFWRNEATFRLTTFSYYIFKTLSHSFCTTADDSSQLSVVVAVQHAFLQEFSGCAAVRYDDCQQWWKHRSKECWYIKPSTQTEMTKRSKIKLFGL